MHLMLCLLSCCRNETTTVSGDKISPGTKRHIVKVAIDYAGDQFKEAKETVQENGVISIGDNNLQYYIDPGKIITGIIDDDSKLDAIVPIYAYSGKFLLRTEHLILLKKGGEFKIAKVFEDVMKIIEIKDSIIFAEISKVAPDSPTYDCAICKEVIKYRYKNGDLIRAE